MSVNAKLISKSIESILLSIELYNKPLITYRTDSVLVLIVNSWESALKALILKKKWAKLSVNKSKDFVGCMECVKSNLGNGYKDDWYHSLKFIYDERCKIIHYNKDLVLIDYMLIQANIILFKQFIEYFFNKNITKKINWFVLPLAIDIPYTEFDFLNSDSSLNTASTEIKNYYKKLFELHNRQLNSGKEGLLLGVNVTLQNVNRIKDADYVVGVSKESSNSFFLQSGIRISSEGKEVQIKEISDVLSVYSLHYKNILVLVKKYKNHSPKKLTEFMNKIGKKNDELSFNWSKFNDIFPMKLSNKFTYSEKILKKYEKYLLGL